MKRLWNYRKIFLILWILIIAILFVSAISLIFKTVIGLTVILEHGLLSDKSLEPQEITLLETIYLNNSN